MKRIIVKTLVIFLIGSTSLLAQETTDVVSIIKKHGMENSQVMEIASWMTDVYGGRLTGSTNLDRATEGAMGVMKRWGMENVHLQEWGPFGRGWDLEHFEMHATAPNYWPIIAFPKAWSSSVSGSGEAMVVSIKEEADLEKYKGKLSGKFVLLEDVREVEQDFDGKAKRHDAESLIDLANAQEPTPRNRRGFRRGGNALRQATWKLLESEKPIAVLSRGRKGDLGTIFVSGATAAEGSVRDNEKEVLPQVTLAVEHYNRIMRMLEKGVPVTLSVDLKASFPNEDGMEHNIIAEIPGTDLKDEVVMFGGHYDSWHASTGATDNASGSAVMMEAARILMELSKETGIKPRRTLRLALWTGEEQGLLGSRGYVNATFVKKAASENSPRELKPESEKISAYYNLDNGTGKVRGIYLQGNSKVSTIFRKWLAPFKDMDASTVSLANTGGTDHLAFDAIGIPGFQFIQEPIAYSTVTHHSNMDNWDHLVGEDLKQAATVIAYFIWQTSQRDELLPRK